MEKLEQLTKRSLRAYRVGRLRMAATIALALLPLSAVCLQNPAFREQSACCAALLLAAAIWFRFRDRRGVEAVSRGLWAGAVPLAAALVLAKLDPSCARAGLLSYCTAFSILGGGFAGLLGALRASGGRSVRDDWFATASIALLVASLGCLRLGVASVVGAGVGIVLGSAVARLERRAI
ncbi:MAG: hypothetical protein ACOY0T_26580 [Myxococcota bacterium]|jgi:hypothetical protein